MNYKYALILLLLPSIVFAITLHLKDYTIVFNKNIYLSDIVKEYIPYTDDFMVGKITSKATFDLFVNNIDNITFDKHKVKIKYEYTNSLSTKIKDIIKYKLSNIASQVYVKINSPIPSSNDYDVLIQTKMPIGWLTVRLLQDGKFYKTISAYSKVYKTVYVAKSNIPSKTIISKKDVIEKTIDITNIYRNLPEKVVKMMSKYYIRKGSVIFANYLMQPLDVVQGETILMLLNYKNISISDYGIALSDGRIGDIIRIMNIKSRNIVIGRVVQKGIVEVIIK